MANNYEINYDDERFTQVESEKDAALSELDKTYDGMISDSDRLVQQQVDATKAWEEKQTELQNEQTNFAIEQIEQQKAQAHKDYIKEQSGAYVDWRKQSNEYGVNAEEMASGGLTNTGYSESSQVSMYNTYQNRVAVARDSYNRAVLNYDNAIKDARLQNNAVLAEIAYNSLQQQLDLTLQGFQYKNTLIIQKADKETELNNMYHNWYQDVLAQINTENALAEETRQFNEQMKLEKEKFKYQKKQDAEAKKAAKASASRSSSSSSTYTIPQTEPTETTGATINTQSVIDAGLGPASGTTIANAVKSGEVTATQKGNQIYIESNKPKQQTSLLPAAMTFKR